MTVEAAADDRIFAKLDAGDIAATLQSLADCLCQSPTDGAVRMFLFQLLCIERDWGRARAQLRIMASQSSEVQMLATAYGQAIDAMAVRGAALEGDAKTPLIAGSSRWAGDFAAVVADDDPSRRAAALADAPDTPGEIDGRRFDFLFDGDGRFGPMLEAIVGGHWGLLPFAAIESVTTEGPVDLRDLVWLPVEIRLRDGGGLAALLPVTYPGTAAEVDPALRLARRTEWREQDGVVHGIGQRIWTTSAGKDVPILEFRQIRFDDPT